MRATALIGTWVGLLVVTGPVLADIGPKPTTSGRNLTPGGDLAGLEVEMAAEEVELVLRRGKKKNHDKLDVVARFWMKNRGETATFETGFPIGAYENFENFSITVDGRKVDFDLVNRSPSRQRRLLGRGRANDYWYVWTATYPGRTTSRHVVRYTVDIAGRPRSYSRFAGYTLSTGAPWKNPIGRATVTLRCTDGWSLDHLVTVKPKQGGVRHADRIVWTFTNLEPTKEHDIRFSYFMKTRAEVLREAREQAATGWRGRQALAIELLRVRDLHLRDRMTDAELSAALDAIAGLVPDFERDDQRLVLPARDPAPGYYRYPQQLFRWLPRMAGVVRAHPESGRARKLLANLLELAQGFLAGRLFAGGEALRIIGTARSRPRTRAKIEAWIAEAREALSGAD
jgi:hypothetical protein